jgi:MFS family permease
VERIGAGLSRLVVGDLSPRFWLAMLLTTVNGASYWLTYSWLPEYLRSRGLSLGASGAYLGVVVAGEILGYAGFGVLSDRVGRRPAFTLFALIMATGLLPLTVLWERFAGTPGLILGATFLVGIGTGTWSNFGPMLAELFPTATRNTAMSTILNCSRAVQFGAPVLIALLEPRFGMGAGIGLAAGFATLASLLVWTLPETRAHRLE